MRAIRLSYFSLLLVMWGCSAVHAPPEFEAECIEGHGLSVDLTQQSGWIDFALEADGFRKEYTRMGGYVYLLTGIPFTEEGTLTVCYRNACATTDLDLASCSASHDDDDDHHHDGDDDHHADDDDDGGDGNHDSNNDSGNNSEQDGDGNIIINNNPVIIIDINDDDDHEDTAPPDPVPCSNVLDLGTLSVSHGGITTGDPRYSGFFLVNGNGELLEDILPACWDVVRSEWRVSYRNASGAEVGSFTASPDFVASTQLTLSGSAGVSSVVTGSVFVVNTNTNVVLELHGVDATIPPA